jgi:predicted neuraminidase
LTLKTVLYRWTTIFAVLGLSILLDLAPAAAGDAPLYRAELVFPLRREHNHAPGLVECSNGDLIASWYRGGGERQSDDVAVYGARLRHGETKWSKTFLMADYPGFPDCNTCMMIDADNHLWLFWPVILANTWESALTNFLVARDFLADGAPKWERSGIILLKPANFKEAMLRRMDDATKRVTERIAKLPEERRAAATARFKKGLEQAKARMDDKLFQRLGWQPRCKPTLLPASDRHPQGRVLLPLYSDTFSVGIMAVSDDKGRNWFASEPIVSWGGIQPSVVPKSDGTLVAYLRDNGGSGHIKVSESKDDGLTWGPVHLSELANPGAGIDAVRLAGGHFCLVYNDLPRGRNNLAVSISDDEGATWKWTRHLEKHPNGAYHYPCVIQGRDGAIHAIYSNFEHGAFHGRDGKSMKHVTFNEAWVKQGDR